MDDLRTPMLIECKYLPFIDILDPDKNPSKIVLCPKLEEIIIYGNHLDQSRINGLLNLTEGRASRSAKLSATTIVSTDALAPTKKVFQLRKHVSRVEYEFNDVLPKWDILPS